VIDVCRAVELNRLIHQAVSGIRACEEQVPLL
jgi:hypothetical protein